MFLQHKYNLFFRGKEFTLMKDLKIDSELRDLLPPLSKEKFEKLEKLILTEGYDGTPILVWNGYIVDGHHRYKIFKKHNIEFNTEDISLPKDCDKSQVMDWMITYQDVRRNLSDAEKIFANDKVSLQRIKEENAKRKLEGNKLGADITNGNAVSVQMGGKRMSHTSPTHTREQRAKQSGVSSGTISRYDTVMSSDDEDLKQSMLSGDVKIGTAYKKVIDSRKKENTNIEPSTSSKSLDKQNNTTQQQYDEQTKKICEFMKTKRKGDYNYDINSDINSLHHLFNKMISDMNDSIFDNHEMMEVISKNDCDTLIGFLGESKEGINSIIEKLEEIKNEQK